MAKKKIVIDENGIKTIFEYIDQKTENHATKEDISHLPTKDEFYVKSQTKSNIRDVNNLLNTGVFNVLVLQPFQEPTFVSIILKLNDLLQKFRILNKRISFKDDISKGDITDLISKIRNAICHLSSGENLLDKESQLKFVFNIAIGKVNAVQLNGKIVAKSEHDDDIAFFYGENRVYLKRHLIRVLNESIETARNLYPNDPMVLF